jgi:SPOR domain
MADNNFRSGRGRDPLAELARLIGQAESYPESGGHESYNSAPSASAATVPADVDWVAEEDYAAHDAHPDERYAASPAAGESYQSYAPQERAYEQQERGYETDPPAGSRYFSGQAGQFNGFRGEPEAYEYDEPPPLPPAHQLQGYPAASALGHGHEVDEAPHGDDDYATDEYYDEAPRPRRRSGLIAAAAIFSLVVVGTAGAFGYRAMFGGSVLPTLPPIIKASNGPIRVAPAYGDSQANNGSDAKQAGAATTGSTENLVSREEQPVAIEPPKAAPRVVATIPIITGQASSAGQALAAASPPSLSAPATTSPDHVASATDSVWPPPPPMPAPHPPAAVAAPAPAPAPVQTSSEPKKVHTVTIRPDQSGSADAAPGSTTPTASPGAKPQSHATTTPRASAPSGNGPLSIAPGGQGDAPPAQRARASAPPMTVATNNTGAVAAPPPAAGGGYAVQVTSQRSEGEAQSAFRALQAKYPTQLGGRAPIIRRADLGEKGTFYRALVGPFGSAEEAAGLCSGLKAAGGNCIVQRN